jgi:hypothetical protein
VEEDDVIEFVLEDREALGVALKRCEELWVVKKFKVSCMLVDPNTSGLDISFDTLVDTTAERSEERLIKQKASHMLIEIESRWS